MLLYLLAQFVLDCYNKVTKSCEKQQSSAAGVPVSYTHLDVYKRQRQNSSAAGT